jgi:hypothetical protein
MTSRFPLLKKNIAPGVGRQRHRLSRASWLMLARAKTRTGNGHKQWVVAFATHVA